MPPGVPRSHCYGRRGQRGSLTSVLLESLAATAADDEDSVEATSVDYESGSAWSEDSDDHLMHSLEQ